MRYLYIFFVSLLSCKSDFAEDKVILNYQVKEDKVYFEYYNNTNDDFILMIPNRIGIIEKKHTIKKENNNIISIDEDIIVEPVIEMFIEKQVKDIYNKILYKAYKDELSFSDTTINKISPILIIIKKGEKKKILYKIHNYHLLKLNKIYTYHFYKIRYRLNHHSELKVLSKFTYDNEILNYRNNINYKLYLEDVFIKDSLEIIKN